MAAAAITTRQTVGLVALLLTAGSANSILSKYQDRQPVTPSGKPYEQPVFQTATMFAGECLCGLAFYALKQRRRLVRRSATHKYSKLPVDDSGVVLNDPDINASSISTDDGMGVQAHKAIVGPDELVPGETEGVEQTQELKGTKNMLMWLPAMFDICGTTLMNVGLLWVPVSVYQMLRGALVLWVGLFSVIFLNRRLTAVQWSSLFIVMLGVAVVGMSNIVSGKQEESSKDVGKAVIGGLLVLFAQLFTASQFVIEEKIMLRYSLEPLRAVGLEGIFGLSTTLFLMPILFFTIGHTPAGQGGYFDVIEGFRQTFSYPIVWITSIAIAFSIAFFNFAGLAVTKSVSATARSLIDTCRTVCIWAVSLLLGWEQFAGLQLVGFSLLVYGTLIFNNVISFPSFLSFSRSKDSLSSSSSRPKSGRTASNDAQVVVIRHNQPTTERTPLIVKE